MVRFLGIRGSLSEFERSGDELTVEWDIHNFLTLSAKEGDYYKSPRFHFRDALWCLKTYSNGVARNKSSGYVSLFLNRQHEGPPIPMKFTISIIGEEGIESSGVYEYTFSTDDSSYGSTEFFSRHVLMEHQSILIPQGMLAVRCIMENVASSPIKTDASIQTDGDSREAEALISHSSAKQGSEKLHEDFAKLLATGEDSDVTVQVGDVKFKAHRAILSARCPVLSAMFRHETEERATNNVKIDDCEPDVFRDFLQYLYTGSVQSLAELNVFGLHRIAEKYLADDLKQHCLEHIRNTICVQTFCGTVQLALTHGESGLLEEAIAFATENIRSIIRSVEWQNFSRDYHTEANEILIKSLGPPK